MKPLEVALELVKEREQAVKKIESYLQLIKTRAKKLLGENTKVYVFGSYVRGDFNEFLSDVDVLIVSPKIKRKIPKIVEVKRKIVGKDIPDLFEIHLVNKKVFEYYKFFCGNELKEIK